MEVKQVQFFTHPDTMEPMYGVTIAIPVRDIPDDYGETTQLAIGKLILKEIRLAKIYDGAG